jgi:hypothetical protein
LFINPTGESDNQTHKNLEFYEFSKDKNRQKINVTARMLDDVLIDEDIKFNNISFIKIDTQGHEWYVLNGAKKLLAESEKIVILCEFAPYLKSWDNIRFDDFYNLISSYGFSIYDTSNFEVGLISLLYLKNNYGSEYIGKYTDLLLVKGLDIDIDVFINM